MSITMFCSRCQAATVHVVCRVKNTFQQVCTKCNITHFSINLDAVFPVEVITEMDKRMAELSSGHITIKEPCTIPGYHSHLKMANPEWEFCPYCSTPLGKGLEDVCR